jgi:hypothetical protein
MCSSTTNGTGAAAGVREAARSWAIAGAGDNIVNTPTINEVAPSRFVSVFIRINVPFGWSMVAEKLLKFPVSVNEYVPGIDCP